MEGLSFKSKLTNDYSFNDAANEFTVLYSKATGKGLKMNDDFKMAVAWLLRMGKSLKVKTLSLIQITV
ncbi:MAG: hypothetical protein BWY46_00504 [Firmicutes bacterium ADurb.Bin300]|nr:MAG: hypothetical protein BWY46_00504 [Firmicutes bacterium ADurb.Bin300]